MDQIVVILILAMTVEALIEYGKLIFVEKQINWKQIGALILGVAIAILAQVDLFMVVEINFVVPYVGMVLTGILLSRGANYVSDFIKLITNAIQKN